MKKIIARKINPSRSITYLFVWSFKSKIPWRNVWWKINKKISIKILKETNKDFALFLFTFIFISSNNANTKINN